MFTYVFDRSERFYKFQIGIDNPINDLLLIVLHAKSVFIGKVPAIRIERPCYGT